MRNAILIPGHSAAPWGVALIFALCGLYALLRPQQASLLSRLFGAFCCLAALWNVALALFVDDPLALGLAWLWQGLTCYGVIVLGFAC